MEAIATGAASNITSEAAKGIFYEVKRHIRYVIFYQKFVEKFEEKHKKLIAKRTSVQQDVDVAERNGEKIKADVLDWRDRTDKVIAEEEKKVKGLEVKAKSKCFIGLCPNIKSRYQLSKKAKQDAATFDELIKDCQFDRVGYRDVPIVVHTDFESFTSREKVFNDIMGSLKDSSMSMIGVYGMPGVGKTSLVKEVDRQVREAKLFDSVVMVIVSQAPDIHKIQDQITESLGLNLEEKSTIVRARRLYERLMNEKKVLIVLDDIWKKLDLGEVGIPFGSQHKGCKILLTSRNQNVLSNGMGATKTFKVGDLDDKEAWEFFKKMAGDTVESDEELRSTAIEVAKRCARLPLAIATVASALQNQGLFVWRDALRQLQRTYSESPSGISSEIYFAIELSFNHLLSEDLKQTFLLCSLLRRDTRIDDLLRYAIGLGLINGLNTLKEARDRLLTMMSILRASCLLLDSNTNKQYFDVHDLTYIVAKSIASKENQMFSLEEEDVLTDWLDGESMKKCNKICLQYPTINKFPEVLNCPQLFLFLLYSKDLSLTLPDNFFKEATNLKVIDLTRMHFSSLPSSIGLLTGLSTLCLDHCLLGDNIIIIGGLINLEILSLLESDIRILPKEIGQLVKLKLLDVSRCNMLKTISPGVLSSLSRLEELYMGDTSIQWEVDRASNERCSASLAELNTLSRLLTLEVQVPDAKATPEYFFQELQKLERYKIFVGKEWEWFGNYQYSRTLKLRLSKSIDDLDRGIKKLLKKTEDLYLDELKGMKIALQALTYEESLSHLKNLHIQNGLDIEYIINDKTEFPQLRSLTLHGVPKLISFCVQHKTGATTSLPQHELPLFSEKILFPCLEYLQLSSINVTRIWPNQLSNTYFCTHEKLTTLKIEDCGNIKHLLSFSMAKCLVHLKDFEISGCNSLREIIFTEDLEEETQATLTLFLFPHLKSLKLRDLQHLIRFCSNSQTQVIEFSSMKLLKIDKCPDLESFICRSTMEGNQLIRSQVLFDNKVAFPSLEEVSISYSGKMKMIWQNPLPENSFPKLQQLEVKGCDELLTIFPYNTLTTFQGLKTLTVKTCASLEQVFEIINEEKEAALLVTVQLRELQIGELPNLKYIWKNDPKGICSFKNLRQISVRNCWSLKTVFPASVARELQNLGDLAILGCGVEEVVSKIEEGSDLETAVTFEFDQLYSLTLWWLTECKCFYPGKHTTKWPMLKELKAYKCERIKILGTLLNTNRPFDSPINPPLFMVEKVIPKLQCLTLDSDYIEVISDGQFPSNLCHEIKAFGVQGDTAKSVNLQISVLERFYNLEKLSIYSCEIKELFCTEGDTGNEMYAGNLSTIRSMNLIALNNLKDHLWKQDVRVDHILPNLETLAVFDCDNLISLGSSSALFKNLTTLDVWNCKGMKYLDACSAVQVLTQLKKLMIRDCISLKEIVSSDGEEATCNITFSRLKSLELANLPRLESFCSGNQAFEFPCLEELIMGGCSEMKIFCTGLLNPSLLQRVEYGNGKGHWDGDLNRTVQQLYSKKAGFQCIGNLVLSELSRSIEIWKEKIHGGLDFKKLKVLEVYECTSLKNIFSTSMVSDLVQLEDIEVKKCPMMEQIIKKDAVETAIGTIRLPKLKMIRLESCSRLTSFYTGSVTLQCPSLDKIVVYDCPKMYAMASTRDQDETEVGGEKTPFFSDKVLCANLQFLELSSTNIQKLWPDIPHRAISTNVHKLRIIIVKGCRNLKYLFPSFLIKKFELLCQVSLLNCDNMEEVISKNGLAAAEGIDEIYVFPKLQLLELIKLPKLWAFCHGDSSETHAQALFIEKVAFPSLNKLSCAGMGNCTKIWLDKVAMDSFYELTFLMVADCERLSNILPFNLVQRLEKLETLQILHCESVEEIIGPDDYHGLNSSESHAVTSTGSVELKSTTKFVFPKIRSLSLHMLPKLKCFYSKMHTTEWPSLKILQVSECRKVETFAGEYINFGEIQGESQHTISVQQPLFWVSEETFPNLDEILFQNGNKEIWHGAHPKQYFCRLRILVLIGFPMASVTFPDYFVRSLPNLQKLFVVKASFSELFSSEGVRDEDEHAATLAHLKELRLFELPELTHLWKKELLLAEVFCKLEILQVRECGKLKNLVPSSVSFKHLTTLEVSKCHGFRNLVTYTMAKSMVKLTRMSIVDCQMLEEVIASTPDLVTDSIIFSQLKSLELDNLPILSRFCSGNYTLVFPSLEEVIVRQCPKMEFFTRGKLCTPVLHGVQSIKVEYVGRWEGDLNAIIHHGTFVEKVSPNLEDLELSSINIQRVWNHKLIATCSYAQNLTCLTIEGCHNLIWVFSSSMVKSFVQLKKLNIENCENVENVICVEEMLNQKLFRVLTFLLLKGLPKLMRFCGHGNYLEFPSLTTLRIETCPTLKAFISGAEENNSEIASQTLFNEKVAFPCLEDLTIIGVGNWRNIWEKQPTNCAVHIEEFQLIEGNIGKYWFRRIT